MTKPLYHTPADLQAGKHQSALADYFSIRLKKQKALYIPYLSLGDPNLDTNLDLCRAMLSSGADILELGIPFSDPIADGPVIQRAFGRALKNEDVRLPSCLEATGQLHQEFPDIPLIYLLYFNLVYSYGIKEMLIKCRDIGIKGLVVPDMPYDSPEGQKLSRLGLDYGVDVIYLITPQTTAERRQAIGSIARGFIYFVSSYGVTGTRDSLASELPQWVTQAQKDTDSRVAVGFGISKPEQAQQVAAYADGVIVGSANHRIVEENLSDPTQMVRALGDYTAAMKKACL